MFSFYFTDADGDNITIFNQLDFDYFLSRKIYKVFIAKARFQENPAVAPIASTSAPNLPRHARIRCDDCDKGIYGIRYKCLECHDFDLCMECEPNAHKHHVMVRIADPNDNILIQQFVGTNIDDKNASASKSAKDPISGYLTFVRT